MDLLEGSRSALLRTLRAEGFVGADYCFPFAVGSASPVVGAGAWGWLAAVGAVLHGSSIVSNRFSVSRSFRWFYGLSSGSALMGQGGIFSNYLLAGFSVVSKNPNKTMEPTPNPLRVRFALWGLSRRGSS